MKTLGSLRHLTGVLLAATGLLTAGCSGDKGCPLEKVDLGVLLGRMTNLNTFAEEPLGLSFMENSYDRSGGNNDWAAFTETEPSGRITVFEAEGPGYISRLWIASFYAERWLFFFDDETEPRIDVARDELFGEKFPFVAPLAGQSSGGRYCLLPIPFSKSIRIEIVPSELRPDRRNYYQINYTKLDLPQDAVSSFPDKLSTVQSNLVDSVNQSQELQAEKMVDLAAELLKGSSTATIAPGSAHTFWEDTGEGVLQDFCIRIDSPEPAEVMNSGLLRQLRLRLFWNRAKFSSVDVPLGDFFCNPLYFRSFSAMPVAQMDEGTFLCRFPMPYFRGAKAQLINNSTTPVTVSAAVKGNKDSAMGLDRLFHARWSASTKTGQPYEMIKKKASGHYVGCFVTAIGQDGSWNILEGDDYMFLDDGDQPPQLGTGLEDYFSGAYYYTSLFDLPLHGLVEKGAMRTDQYRFHLLDSIGFNRSFEMGFEFGNGNSAQGYMSGVVYWYSDKVVNQELTSDQEHLLRRPADRFELPGLMAPFLMLEREGLYADAAVRMDSLAQKYAYQPWADLLRARAVAYRECVTGFKSDRSQYEKLTKSKFASAAKAARDRLWMAESPDRALLGIHALAKYKLLRDGVLVAEGEGRNDLRVLRVPYDGKDHTWEVALQPTHQGSFFSLCLRTQKGDITSAGSWDVLGVEPIPGRKPPKEFKGDGVLPNMTIWSFQPNAYVNMQSPVAGIQLWAFWDSKPKVKEVRLQKKWSEKDIQPLPFEEKERSDAELRVHAVD